MMTMSDHKRLHQRLRKKDSCSVSVAELAKISKAASRREKNKRSNRIQFYETIGKCVGIKETIEVNPNTGTIGYGSWFLGSHGVKLKVINI